MAVVASVPGPQQPLKFSGATLEQTIFRVPQAGRTGMGVSSLGHGGGEQSGLVTDERLCPDPQAVIDRFEPGLERLVWLVWLALMLPSAGRPSRAGGLSRPGGAGASPAPSARSLPALRASASACTAPRCRRCAPPARRSARRWCRC